MTPNILLLILGGLLMLISIIGGGFEVKEIKIPKIGSWARILAGITGIILLIVGVELSDLDRHVPGVNTNPVEYAPGFGANPEGTTQSAITFSLRDELGQGTVSEQVRVIVDGKEEGTLTVNEHYPTSRIAITVPSAGRYSYALEVRTVFINENGEQVEIIGGGQGSITVSDGKVFELRGTLTGDNTWLAHVEEVAQ